MVSNVLFSAKNKRLIIFFDSCIDLWTIGNSNNFSLIEIPAEINRNVSACEITNDEDYLMIATQDSTLYYISIEKMKILFTFDDLENYVTAITFSSNLKEFALGTNDGSLLLYNFNK